MLIKRKYLFGTTILAGVMAVAAPAFAQSQLPGVTVQGQSDGDVTQIGEVVITGSRIRRDPTNSPTPLITVSGEDLQTTGQTTIIDYLATIPALSNSLVPSDTTGSGLNDGGLEFANLRSLGSNRTLTLVDDKGTQAGTWQCTPGAFRSDHSGYVEFMHIVDGNAQLIGDDGTTVDLEAGMVLVIPDGWSGTWDVSRTLTKSFTISRSGQRS